MSDTKRRAKTRRIHELSLDATLAEAEAIALRCHVAPRNDSERLLMHTIVCVCHFEISEQRKPPAEQSALYRFIMELRKAL
jgi:hypothetical protein